MDRFLYDRDLRHKRINGKIEVQRFQASSLQFKKVVYINVYMYCSVIQENLNVFVFRDKFFMEIDQQDLLTNFFPNVPDYFNVFRCPAAFYSPWNDHRYRMGF